MTGPDHHAEMEAHAETMRRRDDLAHADEIIASLRKDLRLVISQYERAAIQLGIAVDSLIKISRGTKGMGDVAGMALLQVSSVPYHSSCADPAKEFEKEYIKERRDFYINEAQRLALLVRSLGGDPEPARPSATSAGRENLTATRTSEGI